MNDTTCEPIPCWAIAKVTDSTPDNLEYGDYRGYVLLIDDVCEQELGGVDEGVAVFATRHGVQPGDVRLDQFLHDQYEWYRTLETSSRS